MYDALSLNDAARRVVEVDHSYLSEPVMLFQQSQVSEDGVFVTRGEFVEDNPAKRFEGLTCNDFALSNILAVGSLPENVSYLTSDNFNIVDKL